MKFFAGVVAAGLAIVATTAVAQSVSSGNRASIVQVSDFDEPYSVIPPQPIPPQPLPPPARYEGDYGYVPGILPPTEVYAILRESGFSPLGIPRRRGAIYTIAVVNRDGDDGRLFIDGRTGRILRFMPAYMMGDRFSMRSSDANAALPPSTVIRYTTPRPPAAIPYAVGRAVPIPKASPQVIEGSIRRPAAAYPQRTASNQAKPVSAQADVPAAPAPKAEVSHTPEIQPTQDMPAAQTLE